MLGVTTTAHVRVVAGMPADETAHLINDEWRVQIGDSQEPPTMAQRSQAGLFTRCCRIKCGVEITLADARVKESLLRQAQVAAAAPTANASSAPSASKPNVKLASTINQASDEEHPLLPEDEIKKGYDNYQRRMETYPPEESEVTKEQYSAFCACTKDGAPYCDFGVWGPHGYRLQAKLNKVKGLNFDRNGQLVAAEIPGPSAYEWWEPCFDTFKTAAIMRDIISPGRLDAYKAHIRHYVQRYGRQAWLVIYQADVRARKELPERIRRTLADEKAAADAAGARHPFNELRPWEEVYARIPLQFPFWKRELEEPAFMILSRVGNYSEVVEGDAPVGNSLTERATPASALGAPLLGDDRPPKRPRQQQQQQQQQQQDAAASRFRHHNLNAAGKFTTNRTGVPLCDAFQKGECVGTERGKCARTGRHAHQCNQCLAGDHGSETGQGCQRTQPGQPRNPAPYKGRGKGSGKKGRY